MTALVGGRSAGPASAADWDARVDLSLARAPAPLAGAVAWLRDPSRRWLRIPAGMLLVCGGLLSILPVLGLWMLPLGLALLGEDVPALKVWLERAALRLEAIARRVRG